MYRNCQTVTKESFSATNEVVYMLCVINKSPNKSELEDH